ncbi:glycosyltransferase [Atlantibacter hermannii]|uniref:glycosyltransferase n=1 Tax=Atlantibacter hermannii TaxID=565 RepID=UPI002905FA63|nr:glycosyltransferase [Atlantibacter hermannii]MDU7390826.1 glycosyltransferase [Atlantibacter hermannii]
MNDKKRVMWLLNHTSARKFEVPMLKECGFDEIFLPKSFPADPSFRSASIDWSEDEHLTIPKEDLEILNNTSWYTGGTREAWRIADKWFDVAFFIAIDTDNMKNMVNNFNGVCVLRAYGLHQPLTYGTWLSLITAGKGAEYIRKLGKRFVFGIAYEHLASIESPLIRDKACYLPLGMNNVAISENWTGDNKNILFVCPDIAINKYYNQVYKDFAKNFAEFDYIVSGAQPISVMDKRVIGFVTQEEHYSNMQRSSVMFYHSQEPYHIHYHPFEAVKNGMPLIFMANGLLDRLGGIDLPGRCKTIAEAKKKIRAIINGDKRLIKKIVESQKVLLKPMNFEALKPIWIKNFAQILQIKNKRSQSKESVYQTKKIAVILPAEYLGGSLRGAQLLANAIKNGSKIAGDNCQVVFYHIDSDIYSNKEFSDLDSSIPIRSFKWKKLDMEESIRAMAYAGYDDWHLSYHEFLIPDDGINYAFDCDLWLIVSDRIAAPILPVKPVGFMVYDYLQRRNDFLHQDINFTLIDAVRRADKVFVTSDFTYQDALQYAGIKKERLSKVPMLIPDFSQTCKEELVVDIDINAESEKDETDYFIWTTNSAPHKNIDKVFEALKIYYDIYNGSHKCVITGVNTDNLLSSGAKHLAKAKKIFSSSKKMKDNIVFKGNLSDDEYKLVLKSAKFLFHSAHGDNGTFSVVEAAFYNVPALSNFYPAIDEMNKNYHLNITYCDIFNEHETAGKMKVMEQASSSIRASLPKVDDLKKLTLGTNKTIYWDELKGLL